MPDPHTTELLPRPEPHYPEGRRWPRPGWRGWVLWLILVVVLIAALVAICTTEMVVDVSLSGSVVAAGASDGPDPQVVLIAGEEAISALRVGMPVRLRIGELNGWGEVSAIAPKRAHGATEHATLTVHILEPQLRAAAVAGQGCDGRVLVGFVKTIRGLWRLATNQAPHATRGTVDELRQLIPLWLRNPD